MTDDPATVARSFVDSNGLDEDDYERILKHVQSCIEKHNNPDGVPGSASASASAASGGGGGGGGEGDGESPGSASKASTGAGMPLSAPTCIHFLIVMVLNYG